MSGYDEGHGQISFWLGLGQLVAAVPSMKEGIEEQVWGQDQRHAMVSTRKQSDLSWQLDRHELGKA